MSAARHFELVDGSSSKFWEVALEGTSVTTRYGKLGTAGKATTKDEGDPDKAQKLYDKLVREKTGKGYVEQAAAPSPAAEKAAPPSTTKKAKAAAVEATIDATTFADVRRLAFESLPTTNLRDERIVDALVIWSHETQDDELLSWLEHFPAEEGWQSHVAGRLAVARVLDGNRPSAMGFLARAEAAFPPEESSFGHINALCGLLPAWWRLAPHKAEAALQDRVRAYFTTYGYTDDPLFSMAALGGHKALVDELLPTLSFRLAQPLRRAISPLVRDEESTALDEVLRAWGEANPDDGDDVSREVLRELVRLGQPERYLELVLDHNELLDNTAHLQIALTAVERANASLAASFAQRLLEREEARDQAGWFLLRILRAHAPVDAAAWATRHTKRSAEELVALGRDAEAQSEIEALRADHDVRLLDIAEMTNNRDLAIEVLKARCENEPAWNCAWEHPRLVALGERVYVDERLERALTELGALPARKRDTACRDFVKDAGALGRVDVAVKCLKLASASARASVALATMEACAQVGDWSNVLVAFSHVKDLRPGDHFDNVMSSAIDVALRESVDATAPKWP
jgi:predicted DNA-binding WGR domain protein